MLKFCARAPAAQLKSEVEFSFQATPLNPTGLHFRLFFTA